MLKKFCASIMLVLMVCSVSYALGDKEYLRMRKDSKFFADADDDLNATWKLVTGKLSGSALKRVKAEQTKWLKSGRDALAKELIKEGDDKVTAYTQAARMRINELLRDEFLYSEALSENLKLYEAENSTFWLKVRTLNRKTSEAEFTFFLMYRSGRSSPGRPGQATAKLTARGKIEDGEFRGSFRVSPHDDDEEYAPITIFFKSDYALEVMTNDTSAFAFMDEPFWNETYNRIFDFDDLKQQTGL